MEEDYRCDRFGFIPRGSRPDDPSMWFLYVAAITHAEQSQFLLLEEFAFCLELGLISLKSTRVAALLPSPKVNWSVRSDGVDHGVRRSAPIRGRRLASDRAMLESTLAFCPALPNCRRAHITHQTLLANMR